MGSDRPSPKAPALRWLRARAMALVDGVLFIGLAWVLGSAARTTSGWLRLVLVILTVGSFASSMVLIGWWAHYGLSTLRRMAPSVSRYRLLVYPVAAAVTGALWFAGILSWLGLSDSESLWLLGGAAVGLGLAWLAWTIWRAIGNRRPDLVYSPRDLPVGWMAASALTATMSGATVGLAIAGATR